MRIGVIGGTGLAGILDGPTHRRETTAWGDVDLELGEAGGREVAFIARHGARLPPHKVRHAAHMDALRACDVDAVLAVQNVGALTRRPAGAIVVPDDLVGLLTPVTRFDDDLVHVAMDPPFCPPLRGALEHAFEAWTPSSGTYVQAPGPRLETPAEVRFLAGLGDVVGMTGASEATIARESGMCYAMACFVANPAAGRGEAVTAPGIRDALATRTADIRTALEAAVAAVPDARDCGCRDAVRAGRI